jgi:hypothetical protein
MGEGELVFFSKQEPTNVEYTMTCLPRDISKAEMYSVCSLLSESYCCVCFETMHFGKASSDRALLQILKLTTGAQTRDEILAQLRHPHTQLKRLVTSQGCFLPRLGTGDIPGLGAGNRDEYSYGLLVLVPLSALFSILCCKVMKGNATALLIPPHCTSSASI